MCTRENLVKCGQLKLKHIPDDILEKFYLLVERFYKKGYHISVAPMGLGEPFLYPGLFKFNERIKKIGKNIKIVIVTNGILFNKSLGEKLVKFQVDEISVSLNCKSSLEYKKIMGVDTYSLVKKNILDFINLRKKYKSILPHIFIQYLDFKNNFKDFDSEILKWKKVMLPEDKCYVHPIVNQAGYKKGINDVKGDIRYPCISPLSRLVFKINGDAYPCDACLYNGSNKEEQLLLGNLLKSDLMKEFELTRGKSHKIFDLMRKNDYSNLSVCKRCNTYKLSPNCYFSLPFNIKIKNYKWF